MRAAWAHGKGGPHLRPRPSPRVPKPDGHTGGPGSAVQRTPAWTRPEGSRAVGERHVGSGGRARGLAPGLIFRVQHKPGPSHGLLVIEGFELNVASFSPDSQLALSS